MQDNTNFLYNLEGKIKGFVKNYYIKKYGDKFEEKIKLNEKKVNDINKLIEDLSKENKESFSYDTQDVLVEKLYDLYNELPIVNAYEQISWKDKGELYKLFSEYISKPLNISDQLILTILTKMGDDIFRNFDKIIKHYDSTFIEKDINSSVNVKMLDSLNLDIPYDLILAFAGDLDTKEHKSIQSKIKLIENKFNFYISIFKFTNYEDLTISNVMNFFEVKSFDYKNYKDETENAMRDIYNNIVTPVSDDKYYVEFNKERDLIEVLLHGNDIDMIRRKVQYFSSAIDILNKENCQFVYGVQSVLGVILSNLSKEIDFKNITIFSDTLNTLIPIIKNNENIEIEKASDGNYYAFMFGSSKSEIQSVLDDNNLKLAIEGLKKKYSLKSAGSNNTKLHSYVDGDSKNLFNSGQDYPGSGEGGRGSM